MANSSIRMGVDIGGTFTDVVLEIDGQHTSTKVLTTYAAPENAIIEGIGRVCDKAGISPSDIQQIIHGTTLATNALIENVPASTNHCTRTFPGWVQMRHLTALVRAASV